MDVYKVLYAKKEELFEALNLKVSDEKEIFFDAVCRAFEAFVKNAKNNRINLTKDLVKGFILSEGFKVLGAVSCKSSKLDLLANNLILEMKKAA